jgi:hypothetical protein
MLTTLQAVHYKVGWLHLVATDSVGTVRELLPSTDLGLSPEQLRWCVWARPHACAATGTQSVA